MALVVGIDFGNTFSCASWWDGRTAQIIELPDGRKQLPSAVAVVGEDIFVGWEALAKGKAQRQYLFQNFKRRLGEVYHEESESGHQTCADPKTGLVAWKGPDDHIIPTVQLAAWIIDELLDAAEAKLGERPTGAVITIPADSGNAQREATLEAARLAGLLRVELEHEPTMAALSYGFDFAKRKVIAVPDAGGSTFDISIIETGKGRNGQALVEVLATDGRRKGAGGMDFDREIARYLAIRWRTLYPNSDISADAFAMDRVLESAEEAKRALSGKPEARVFIPELGRDENAVSLSMDEVLDLKTYAALSERLTDQITAICRRAVEKAKERDPKFQMSDIGDVVLVGGMTRSQPVRDAIRAVFGKEPRRDVNPEEAVALGAAIKAAIISGRMTGVTVRDIISHPISVETIHDVATVIFPSGSTYPQEKTIYVANADEGQQALSVAVLEGTGLKASDCTILATHDHIVSEPAPVKANELKLVFKLDEGGRLSVESADGWSWRGAA
jgi:molecular chaperone DnaK